MPQIDITLKSSADVGGFQKTSQSAQELQRILNQFGSKVFVPLASGIETVDRQMQTKISGWERALQRVGRAFSPENIAKSVLGGLGVGSAFAIIDTVISRVERHYAEIEKRSESIRDNWREIRATQESLATKQMTPAERLAFLQSKLSEASQKVAGTGVSVSVARGQFYGGEQRDDQDPNVQRALLEYQAALKDYQSVLAEVRQAEADLAKDRQTEGKKAMDQRLDAEREHIRLAEEDLKLQEQIREAADKALAKGREMDEERAKKAQRELVSSALRDARSEVEAYDIALSALAANPYLTDAEREPKRIAIIDAQTEAIKRLRTELEALAQSNPELAAQIGGEIGNLGERAARNRGMTQGRASRLDQSRTAYRASQQDGYQTVGEGAEGGVLSYLSQLGTMADQVAAGITNTLGAAVDGITNGIMGWINGTMTFGQALANIGNSILQTILQTLVQMGVRMVLNAALSNVLQKAAAAAAIATAAPTAVALSAIWAGPATLAAIATLGAASAQAPASVLAAKGVILASSVAGFLSGGFTPDGPAWQAAGIVHAGEWVAPQWMVNDPVAGAMIGSLEAMRSGGTSALTRPGFAPTSASGATSGTGSPSSRGAQVVYVDHRNQNALEQLQRDPRFETTVVHIMRKNRGIIPGVKV